MTKRMDDFERIGALVEELPDPRPEAREAARAELLARIEATEHHGAQPVPRGRLLTRGVAGVAQAFKRPRHARLIFGAACTAVLVAAAMILTSSDVATPAAYAVEAQPGGGVKIKIYKLSDPEGVEQALEEAGVASQVNYLKAGMACREPHYQPSMAMLRTLGGGQPQPQPWAGFNYESADGPLTIAVGDFQQRQAMDKESREAARNGDASGADWPDFVIDPTGLRPDQTLIITSSPTPDGYQQPGSGQQPGVDITRGRAHINTVGQVRVAEGEVGPCDPVPAAEGPAPVRAPEGGWDFSDAPYAGWGFEPGFGGAK